jgi:hypothetical protein
MFNVLKRYSLKHRDPELYSRLKLAGKKSNGELVELALRDDFDRQNFPVPKFLQDVMQVTDTLSIVHDNNEIRRIATIYYDIEEKHNVLSNPELYIGKVLNALPNLKGLEKSLAKCLASNFYFITSDNAITEIELQLAGVIAEAEDFGLKISLRGNYLDRLCHFDEFEKSRAKVMQRACGELSSSDIIYETGKALGLDVEKILKQAEMYKQKPGIEKMIFCIPSISED